MSLEERENSIENVQLVDSASDNDGNCLTEEDQDEKLYERRMRHKHQEKLNREHISLTPACEFETICRTFNPTRVKVSENIIKWWSDHKNIYPDLYQVASVILVVPCTQVSVERLFSQLRYILDPLRNRLSEEVIDDILFLKSNIQHFEF